MMESVVELSLSMFVNDDEDDSLEDSDGRFRYELTLFKVPLELVRTFLADDDDDDDEDEDAAAADAGDGAPCRLDDCVSTIISS